MLGIWLLLGARVEIGVIEPAGDAEGLAVLVRENTAALLECWALGPEHDVQVSMKVRVEQGRAMSAVVQAPQELEGCLRSAVMGWDFDSKMKGEIRIPLTFRADPATVTTPGPTAPAAYAGPTLQVASVLAKDEAIARRVIARNLATAAPCYEGVTAGGQLVISSRRGVLEDGIGDAAAAECLALSMAGWAWPSEAGSDVVVTFGKAQPAR